MGTATGQTGKGSLGGGQPPFPRPLSTQHPPAGPASSVVDKKHPASQDPAGQREAAIWTEKLSKENAAPHPRFQATVSALPRASSVDYLSGTHERTVVFWAPNWSAHLCVCVCVCVCVSVFLSVSTSLQPLSLLDGAPQMAQAQLSL